MSNQKRNNDRRKIALGFGWIFTKQLIAFVVLTIGLILLDIFICIAITIDFSTNVYQEETPRTILQHVDQTLINTDGEITLSQDTLDILDNYNIWILILDENGSVLFEYNVPDDVPRTYTLTDLAVNVRSGTISNYPIFIWDSTDLDAGLIIAGFPIGSFNSYTVYYPTSLTTMMIFLAIIVFFVDILIVFIYFLIVRRKTAKSIRPISDALDNLSLGIPTTTYIKGDLKLVAEKINQTSEVIQQKDKSRSLWIRGISHDIRTPLSMVLGYANEIYESDSVSDEIREEANKIQIQAMKIKDLILDLNTASQLTFSYKPLNITQIHLAKLVRKIAADYMNSGAGIKHPLEVYILPVAQEIVYNADERMLTRALENLLINAVLHNENGCKIAIGLAIENHLDNHDSEANRHIWSRYFKNDEPSYRTKSFVILSVTDNGVGLNPEKLATLRAKIEHSLQVPEVQTTEDGHGLGLTLVGRIALSHGGRISIDSTEKEGFSVRIELPL